MHSLRVSGTVLQSLGTQFEEVLKPNCFFLRLSSTFGMRGRDCEDENGRVAENELLEIRPTVGCAIKATV